MFHDSKLLIKKTADFAKALKPFLKHPWSFIAENHERLT